MLLKHLEEVKSKLLQRGKTISVIGSEDFKAWYLKSLVDKWIDQLKLLFKIGESELQSDYSVIVGG